MKQPHQDQADDFPEPPRKLFRLVKPLLRERYAEELEGDMEERFCDNLNQFGGRKARSLYQLDTIKLIRPSLLKRLGGDVYLNQYGMLMNNVKIAVRQIRKHKVLSTIKIGSFAIGIAACILIALYIKQQTSYDQHYERGDQIYRMTNQWSKSGEVEYWTSMQGPLKKVLEDNIPEMEKVSRVVTWRWANAGANHIRSSAIPNNNYEKGFLYADPEILEILEVPMVSGSQSTALKMPNSLVISESKAAIYFPNQNPIGQDLILNNKDRYVIGGVMKDFPSTSHLQGDFIMTLYERKSGPGTSGWCCTNYDIYVKLNEYADKAIVEEKMLEVRNSLVMDHLKEAKVADLDEKRLYQSYYLQPVSNIFLNPEEVGDYLEHGVIELVWIFGFIAIVILSLACVNFINLSVANSTTRSKEIGLLKVVGSKRSSLIVKYLVESCIYSLISVAIGAIVAAILLPFFNVLADTAIVMPWSSASFLLLLVLTALVIGILSGIYPALVLSGFRPIEAIKGRVANGRSPLMQQGLVIMQFTATVVLIITALVLQRQFDSVMNKPLGYDREQVVNIFGLNTLKANEREALKDEMLNLSVVQNATLGDYIPVEGTKIHNRSYWQAGRKYLDPGLDAARWTVDTDYIPTMKMELVAGRNFMEGTVDSMSIILNERMVEVMGIKDPVGKRIIDMFDEEYHVIGVVKNFDFESALGSVRPLVMVAGQGQAVMSVRINSSDVAAAMASITATWDRFSPNQSARFQFMDIAFERMYKGFGRAKVLFIIFSVLSIVIACSGMFALSLYLIARRTKEISIRKVLGASVSRILKILTFGFVRLVLIAMVLAIPIAYHFTEYILEDFAYRIDVTWDIFLLGGVLATVVALATISFESMKAALTNPAQQLKDE